MLLIVVIIIGLIYLNINRSTTKGAENSPEDVQEELISLDDALEREETGEEELEDISLIVVDIKGAVTSPGIYEMEDGDRIHNLVSQAGGFTKQANEADINLAQRLQDEMVIVVPKKGEKVEEISNIPSVTSTANNSTQEEAGDKIKLNEASQTELETLSGIGPSKAQAIIDYREENGAFQTVEDILQVSGIGEKTLEAFKDDIIVP